MYICQTYKVLTPCLKGIHITIDRWRVDRNVEGWKDTEFHTFIKAEETNSKYSHNDVRMSSDYPTTVKPVI